MTGDAGDAGDADVRAQMAGGCSARGKGESLGCCVTWTGGAGRGAAGQVARTRGLRKEGSWASRESAGPQRGVLGRHRERERGPGLGLVWAGVWGLAGFWVLPFFFYF